MQGIRMFAGAMAATALLLAGGMGARAADDPTAPMARTTSDFIRELTPRPAVKTRGIALGTGAAPAAPAKAPKVNFQVEFEYNSAALTPQAAAVLDELGRALVSPDLMPFRFQLTGHTDASGSAAYNLDLSRRRAASVEQYLASRFQIAPSRLVATGRGEEQLLDTANPNSGVNRRVEIINLGG